PQQSVRVFVRGAVHIGERIYRAHRPAALGRLGRQRLRDGGRLFPRHLDGDSYAPRLERLPGHQLAHGRHLDRARPSTFFQRAGTGGLHVFRRRGGPLPLVFPFRPPPRPIAHFLFPASGIGGEQPSGFLAPPGYSPKVRRTDHRSSLPPYTTARRLRRGSTPNSRLSKTTPASAKGDKVVGSAKEAPTPAPT